MSGTINVKEYFESFKTEGTDDEKSASLSCSLCSKAFAEDADDKELAAHLYAAHLDEDGEVQQKAHASFGDTRIWNYYEKVPDEDQVGRCCECGKHVRHHNNLTGLKHHLRTHADAYEKYLAERSSADPECFQTTEDMPLNMARWYKKGHIVRYFECVDLKERRARCNACGGIYTFRSTVGNLKNHLKKAHPPLFKEMRLAEGFDPTPLDGDTEDEDDKQTEHRPRRTIDLGDYFDKYEDEDERSLRCTLCKRSFSEEEGDGTLVAHLFADHPDQVEVQKSRRRPRPTDDVIWDFFEVYNRMDQIAKCNYCEERGSYASGSAELAIHLSRAHPDHFEVYMERKLDVGQSDEDSPTTKKSKQQDNNSKPKHRRNRSLLWEHFKPEAGGRARCMHCNSTLSYRSTTGNLKHHLRRNHPQPFHEFEISERNRQEAACG